LIFENLSCTLFPHRSTLSLQLTPLQISSHFPFTLCFCFLSYLLFHCFQFKETTFNINLTQNQTFFTLTAMKHPKPQNPITPTPSPSSRSSLSSHLAMVELKQRILTSLSKLSDRDTHQIAVEDLEKTIAALSPDAIPMILNCLYDAATDPKPAVKRDALRLLAAVCAAHGDAAAAHLTKIIGHVVRRLKDADSAVRDACRDTVGALAAQYLKGDGGGGGVGTVVGLFVKPLFEAMGEQNKGVQAGAAVCMAKMVECAGGGGEAPVPAFQKLCPRICKLLNSPNFMAKAAILPVVASLSQVRGLHCCGLGRVGSRVGGFM